MAKDAKGHGSNAGASFSHRGFSAHVGPGGVKVMAPNDRHVATHSTLAEAKQAIPHYAKGYESAQAREAQKSRGNRSGITPNVRGDVSSPRPRKPS